jgi:hypothetical protein
MSKLEEYISKFIEDKFSFPYLHYNKIEQTWTNEFFLFDIKTSTMYVSDEVKSTLNQKFGKEFIKCINSKFKKRLCWTKNKNCGSKLLGLVKGV